MTAFCTKCGVRVDVDVDSSECSLCHFDTVVPLPEGERSKRCPWCGEDCPRWGRETCPFRPRQLPRPSEDKLHAAAKRYHEVRERLRRLKGRDSYAVSMARDSLEEDLRRVADDLHLAADEYGRDG
jgi:hypothetical protein